MKKSTENIYLSLAFLWFTTHFGGGFASGRQVVEYFVRYGKYAIIMPVISQAVIAIVLYAAWMYAFENKAFYYRVWTDKFYKPVEKVMSNVYELLYNLTLITATAVAFATGGATMKSVFGTSYLFNTALIAAALLLLTIFGAKFVRRAASVIAIAIIAGMFIIYIPNIIAGFPKIAENLSALSAAPTASGLGLFDALWTTLKYAGFQSVVIGAYIAHSSALEDKKDIMKASVLGFVLNASMLVMTVLGLHIFMNDGILTESVPALTVIRNGVGAGWMVPLISVLILLGAVSTGVNLIYGITQRVVILMGKNDNEAAFKSKERNRSIIVSAVYVMITWSIAQFGLIPLIAKGYGTLGYISVFVIILPIVLKFYLGRLFTKAQNTTENA